MGTRPACLERALSSVGDTQSDVTVVVNADDETLVDVAEGIRVVRPGRNLGVPGGRDVGLRATNGSPVVGFLDDDAVFHADSERVSRAFASDEKLGAVAFRLVDDRGETARRHVPRLGGKDPGRSGDVALFLGGACAIRRDAYDEVGGYFADLQYGHEEVELCWRLIDAGWKVAYLADIEVYHPRTPVERHVDGWRLTGRNRVLIARRTLPWPVAIVHVGIWLILGAIRAPGGECRRNYLTGWRQGWSLRVERQPISWRGVARLTRLGRPPIV